MKIITIVGARPQFIKAAVVSRAFREKGGIEEVILHTGQHFDSNMSDIFFKQMDIPEPKYNLNINSLSHGVMTGKMLEGIENILQSEKPDMVLVYGDTNSTLAGALAAAKLHISIAHVESGLRSFNMKMPEEINRILTDRISSVLFCPTENSVSNLQKEGFESFDARIVNSGDVMYDAALYYSNIGIDESRRKKFEFKEFVLATIHREENVRSNENLTSIISSLNIINSDFCRVVAPLHPGTLKRINELNLEVKFKILEPLSYMEMIYLVKSCKLVVTDSGGLQKEAFFFNKFCLTAREETEWTELTENRFNFLVGTQTDKLITLFEQIINMDFPPTMFLFGKGNAGGLIVEELTNF